MEEENSTPNSPISELTSAHRSRSSSPPDYSESDRIHTRSPRLVNSRPFRTLVNGSCSGGNNNLSEDRESLISTVGCTMQQNRDRSIDIINSSGRGNASTSSTSNRPSFLISDILGVEHKNPPRPALNALNSFSSRQLGPLGRRCLTGSESTFSDLRHVVEVGSRFVSLPGATLTWKPPQFTPSMNLGEDTESRRLNVCDSSDCDVDLDDDVDEDDCGNDSSSGKSHACDLMYKLN